MPPVYDVGVNAGTELLGPQIGARRTRKECPRQHADSQTGHNKQLWLGAKHWRPPAPRMGRSASTRPASSTTIMAPDDESARRLGLDAAARGPLRVSHGRLVPALSPAAAHLRSTHWLPHQGLVWIPAGKGNRPPNPIQTVRQVAGS